MAAVTTRSVVTRASVYNIELSEREALTLAVILGSVGGSEDGVRVHSQALLTSLEMAGVRWYNNGSVSATGIIKVEGTK